MTTLPLLWRMKGNQMAERIRTVCSKGQLVLTEETIVLEFGTKRTILYRNQLIGIESKVTSPKFLWSPGTTKITFSTSSGQHLEVGMIRTPVAQEILAELNKR